MTPLDVVELPPRSFNNVLSAVSVARLARSESAEASLDKVTVEFVLLPPLLDAVLAEDAALAVEASVAALSRPDRVGPELLLTLPIAIMARIETADVTVIAHRRRDFRGSCRSGQIRKRGCLR